MRFNARIPVSNGAAPVDPVTSPEDVPGQLLTKLPDRAAASSSPFGRIILGLQAGAGETVTVDLWAMEEPPRRATEDFDIPKTDRVFHRFATGVVVTANVLNGYTGSNLPTGGFIYIRQVADTLAADGEILVAVGS